MSVVPMYMPGRRRTASSPSRTWMSFALYELAGFCPFVAAAVPFTSSFLTATCSPYAFPARTSSSYSRSKSSSE
jgi:hypothetical protein